MEFLETVSYTSVRVHRRSSFRAFRFWHVSRWLQYLTDFVARLPTEFLHGL